MCRSTQSGVAGRRSVDQHRPSSGASKWSVLGLRRPRVRGQVGCDDVVCGHPSGDPRPAARRPLDPLDRGLPAEHTVAQRGVGAANQVGQVPLAVLRADQAAVTRLLQPQFGPAEGGEQRPVRVHLVRPEQLPGPRHGDLVLPAGAALGGDQPVPAVVAVQVRALGDPDRGAGEQDAGAADQTARGPVVLLDLDAAEAVPAGPPVRAHAQQPTGAVVVVEQRGVETAPVQFHRIRPGAGDVLGGDQEVLRVPVAAGKAGDVAVDEMELAVVVRQVGRPHPVGVAAASQVEQAAVGDDPTQGAPVHEITRMVHTHARIPLEGRGGQVVVVPDTQDRRVRVEPGEGRDCGSTG